MTSVSFVSVNYNSTNLINKLETQLAEFDVDYIVVDNSGDFQASRAATKTVVPPENIGFGRGCNLGIKASNSEKIILLNPDVVFDQKNLGLLISFCLQQETPSVFAPLAYNGTGQVVTLESPGRFGLRFRRRALTTEELNCGKLDVIYASGACMCVHRKIFEATGGFSDKFFLYGEDLEFCMRAKAIGASVFLCTDIIVKHQGGRSSPGLDRVLRLFRSVKGHYILFRLYNSNVGSALINSVHLASGWRI